MRLSDEEQYVNDLAAALGEHPGLQWELTAQQALIVLSHLQLALRHPGNRGATAREARSIANGLIAVLARGNERVEELLRRGDNPEFDQ